LALYLITWCIRKQKNELSKENVFVYWMAYSFSK
jgi:prolipoprotein diacylglyceryltransferase